MVLVVEPFLPSKCKVLNSNPSTTKKKKEKRKRLKVKYTGQW
jgi:hypothetical protein